eukprot:TRINITY_DN1172_c0_g1_i5.p1 TRINITY_DN1172_c0_g1~~TRINITY_DN1172_c0_g1_i5.p1  ORF type:complete len:274 (-),score=94.78 TRINITY_DN1172_c0_g1_i5:1272-2093(-)
MGNSQSADKSEKKENQKVDEAIEKVKGTDVTYQVDDLLRKTDAVMNWDDSDPVVTREELPVPGAFLLHNVLTEEECKQFIQIAEDMEFTSSPLRNLSTLNSDQSSLSERTQQIRNSERVLFDASDQMGIPLNRRILPHLMQTCECEGSNWKVQQIGEGKAKGPINSRWRFNKYHANQYFKPHFDAGFVYDDNEKTLFTFILYLSEGFEGGETTFFPGDKKVSWDKPIPGIECKVKPKMGSALVFFQAGKLNPRHEGTHYTLSNFGQPKRIILI